MAFLSKRQGRIKIQSGDSTPLSLTVAFTEGDFSWTITRNINQVLDRGDLVALTKGDDSAVEWSFTAKFVNRLLYETMEEFVWAGQTESITGLTASALNSNVPTTLGLGYKQGTLFVTDSGYTKLATSVAPSVAGEYRENVGVEDEEGVLVVTGFDVFQPAADTTVAIFYGAVGTSRTDPDLCSDVKTYLVVIEFDDPCDLPNVLETWAFDFSAPTSVQFDEGDVSNTIAFSGIAMIKRPTITPAGPPPPTP